MFEEQKPLSSGRQSLKKMSTYLNCLSNKATVCCHSYYLVLNHNTSFLILKVLKTCDCSHSPQSCIEKYKIDFFFKNFLKVEIQKINILKKKKEEFSEKKSEQRLTGRLKWNFTISWYFPNTSDVFSALIVLLFWLLKPLQVNTLQSLVDLHFSSAI